MDDIRDIFKKYIKPNPNPNALSFTMVGISTLMLVYFVAYKEEPATDVSKTIEESESIEKESLPTEEEQITGGGHGTSAGKRRHNKNKKTKRRKL